LGDSITKITDFLIAQGLAGLIIIALSFAVWRLWNELKSERNKNEALQEKRIEESRENLTALHASTTTLDRLTQVISTSAMLANRGRD
jgi:hypothetical protein